MDRAEQSAHSRVGSARETSEDARYYCTRFLVLVAMHDGGGDDSVLC